MAAGGISCTAGIASRRFWQTSLLTAAVLQVALIFGTSTALANHPCAGVTSTIHGTEGDDVISGTPGNDVIQALGGSDTVDGLGGNDRICGGEGRDFLGGFTGNDIVAGQGGDDVLDGEAGDDVLIGGAGFDTGHFANAPNPVNASLSTIPGTATGDGTDRLLGIEELSGSEFNDTLTGNAANNTLNGNDGNDILDGRAGFDTLNGGAGSDSCVNGENTLDCEGVPPLQYVALGDSYSSGTGTGLYDAGTGSDGNECYRSSRAYPRVFASGMPNLLITHVACSGARIRHVLTESKGGEPPQIQALSDQGGLVTITIGGNDIEFPTIIQARVFIIQFCGTQLGFDPDRLIRDVRAALPGVYSEIRRRAPTAQILVLGYPLIIPEPRTLDLFGVCLSGISRLEMVFLRRWNVELNRAIRDAVQLIRGSGGVNVAFLDLSSAFRGREICRGDDRFVNEVTIPLVESFHPNPAGHAWIGHCVDLAVRQGLFTCPANP